MHCEASLLEDVHVYCVGDGAPLLLDVVEHQTAGFL